MSNVFQVAFFSMLAGALSLCGGLFLLKSKKSAKVANLAAAFAAGALLAAAFFDLLPEALEDAPSSELILGLALCGILAFFLLEQSIHWFHHHKHSESHAPANSTVPLLVIGDTIHNFVDGVAIAAAFLVSPAAGIVAALAVAAHEVPQEIGDFGVMLKSGVKKSKILLINLLSSLATVASAVVFFLFGEAVDMSVGAVLAVAAGFFIYIAVSDLIPEIHNSKESKVAKTLFLFAGVAIVAALGSLLHSHN
jgi:zinc and cadmium transporter